MANKMTLQLHAAAAAAKRLYHKGQHGPKLEEIAEEAHGGLWPIGREDINWFKKHLPQIRNILDIHDNMAVCLVNKEYYTKFHRNPPETVELAKTVLPKPGSFSSAGLHFATETDDTIFRAWQEKIRDGGLGSIGKVNKNYHKAIKRNLISQANGDLFVREIKNKTEKLLEAKDEDEK